MCKSGTASSKLDFVLAKNMQDNALQSCEIDEEFVAKGGHVILRMTAKMPHVEVMKLRMTRKKFYRGAREKSEHFCF